MSPQRINLAICRRCPDCEAQPKNGGCSGPCKCMVNGRDIRELSKENNCPAGKYPRNYLGRLIERLRRRWSKPTPSNVVMNGPRLWAELHGWALYGDIDRPLLWLAEFTERVGRGVCGTDWKDWMLANPPNIASRDTLFEWTWRAHEAVNAKLGKPSMTLADALARWNK